MAIIGGGMMESAEQHSLALAANSIRWLLEHGTLTHPGLKGHLTVISVHLTACQTLIDPKA